MWGQVTCLARSSGLLLHPIPRASPHGHAPDLCRTKLPAISASNHHSLPTPFHTGADEKGVLWEVTSQVT